MRGTRSGRVTLDDVAGLAGVSRATASRVVRGHRGVNKSKEDAVRWAITELGYIPDLSARALASRRSNVIAMVAPSPGSTVVYDRAFARTVAAFVSSARALSLEAIMVFDNLDHPQNDRFNYLFGGRVDAAVVLPHHGSSGQVEAMMNAPIPVVFIGQPPEPDEVAWVDMDDREAGALAASYLCDHGATAPSLVTGPAGMTGSRNRMAGFLEAMAARGIRPRIIHSSIDEDSGPRVSRRIAALTRDGQIDGLFVASDVVAPGILGHLDALNVPIGPAGGGLPVAVVNDTEPVHDMPFECAVVNNPIERIAECGANMVRWLMEGGNARGGQLVQIELTRFPGTNQDRTEREGV